jgi:hypothetical protein
MAPSPTRRPGRKYAVRWTSSGLAQSMATAPPPASPGRLSRTTRYSPLWPRADLASPQVFVGGNADFPDDKGFALAPWAKARYDNAVEGSNAIQVYGDIALTMGNVYLTGADGKEVMVDKVFAFRKCSDGKLRLVVHKSALPNVPAK